MQFIKKYKRKIILALLLAYIVQAVPVYLVKNSYVLFNSESEEITYLHSPLK